MEDEKCHGEEKRSRVKEVGKARMGGGRGRGVKF